VEELLAERGIAFDHVTVYRWVQRFTCDFTEAARPCRRLPGDRWFVDEACVRVAGRWTYLSRRRDLPAARTFFTRALTVGVAPTEVTTDRAAPYPRVLDERVPAALHVIEQATADPEAYARHYRLVEQHQELRGRDAVKMQQIADELSDLLTHRGSDEPLAVFAGQIALACYQTAKRATTRGPWWTRLGPPSNESSHSGPMPLRHRQNGLVQDELTAWWHARDHISWLASAEWDLNSPPPHPGRAGAGADVPLPKRAVRQSKVEASRSRRGWRPST
jgi:IS6 family transposase